MHRESILDHIPSLRRYARALTGNAWAADDLVQDTLERACAKWRLWLVGSDLRAWLFTLMHNIFANQLRRQSSQSRAGVAVDLDEVGEQLVDPRVAPDVALDLQRCLQRLPEEQRAVLLLVTLEDLSYQAASVILGIPVGTVMSRLSRARSRLRELMDGAAGRAQPEPGRATYSAGRPTAALRRLK